LQQQQPRRNIHLILLGSAHSLNHSLFVVAPPLLTLIMSDLGVSNSVIGAVSTGASMLYGVGALAGGLLGDKIGEAKTIILFLICSGFSTFIMLAAWATRSIYVYTLALALIAIWASLYHPTANSLISKAFTGKVSESMGLHGVGGTLGVVLTPTMAWLLGSTLGWSWAFAAFGLACILLALFFVRFFGKTKSQNEHGGTIINVFKIRKLWTLLIFNVLTGLFMKGVELWFPTYLQNNRQIDPMWASIAYTTLLAFGVPGQWIGGKASDKIGPKKVLIAATVGVCVSLLSLLLIPVYIVGIALFLFLYGFFFNSHQPALTALTGFLTPQVQRGAVYGVFFFTSFGLGSISQFIAGYLAEFYGLDVAFYALTVFALAALILSFKIPDKRENR